MSVPLAVAALPSLLDLRAFALALASAFALAEEALLGAHALVVDGEQLVRLLVIGAFFILFAFFSFMLLITFFSFANGVRVVRHFIEEVVTLLTIVPVFFVFFLVGRGGIGALRAMAVLALALGLATLALLLSAPVVVVRVVVHQAQRTLDRGQVPLRAGRREHQPLLVEHEA